MDDFESRLCALTRNYTPFKRFICLKWIIKNFSTILPSQFNFLTLFNNTVKHFSTTLFNTFQQHCWTLFNNTVQHFSTILFNTFQQHCSTLFKLELDPLRPLGPFKSTMWFLRKNASYKIFIVTWRTGPSSLGLIYAPAYIKPVNSKNVWFSPV